MTERTCENCGAAAAWEPLFEPRFQVERCMRCGGWHYRGSLDATLEELYDASYFQGREYLDYAASTATHHLNFRRKLDVLRKAGVRLDGSTRLLEIGAATGEFLKVARDAGVKELLGVEVSDFGLDGCKSKGLEASSPFDAGLDGRLAAFRPTVIVAWDVWEHLERPATTIEHYLSFAAPEHWLAISTVDASGLTARARGPRWRQFHPPTHLNYPTRTSLDVYCRRHDMRVTHHAYFGYYRPLFEYVGAIAGKLPAAVTRSAVAQIPVYLNLYDTQLIVAAR